MERRTKTGNKMGIIGLSDPTGHFEAVLFSEGLAQYREVLEPGAAVLLQLGAELQGEDVRARVLHAEPLDAAAAKTQKGLRIFVRDTKPLDSIARRLNMPEPAAPNGTPKTPAAKPAPAPVGAGDGDVSLVIMLDLETEVEMKLPGRFKVSPQIAGAIKAVSGVVDVQTLEGLFCLLQGRSLYHDAAICTTAGPWHRCVPISKSMTPSWQRRKRPLGMRPGSGR